MSGEATRTPWRIHPLRANVIVPVGGSSVRVAVVGSRRYGPEEADANAAFIVRAVNAHAELVSALQGMVALYDMDRAYVPDGVGTEAPLVVAARATLAKIGVTQ